MFDLGKLIDKYYDAIEKHNTNLINQKTTLLSELKEKNIKRALIRNILKSDEIESNVKTLYRFEKILNDINKDKRLLKLYNGFKKHKSIYALKNFIQRRNQLVGKYGYKNYNDFFISRIQCFGYKNFDFNKMIQNGIINIVPNVYKLQEDNINCDIKISNEEFERTLSKINQKIYLVHNELNKSGKILLNHSLCDQGALSVYMPKSNQCYICTQDLNLERCYDFIAHELGHVLERCSIDAENKIHTILLDVISGEMYSSMLELLFITQLSNLKVAKRLNMDYISQIAYQMLNLSIEYELNQNQNKISEDYVKFLWNDNVEKLLKYKKQDKNFTWDRKFNLSLEMYSMFKYLFGRMVALLMKENNKLNYDNFINLCQKRNVFDIENLKQVINLE